MLLTLLLAPALLAQAPTDLFEKAPPHIDEALRARITKFYQAHVDGKFRLADTVVAEDSKDMFFAADKVRYYSFEIAKITYSENFTRATALVACDSDFVAAGHRLRVKMPMTSLWKMENGEWWWYALPPSEEKATPFGVMRSGTGERTEQHRLPSVEELLRKVQVSKTAVELSSYQPASDEVVVSNGMPGPIRLRLQYEAMPGFEAKLDRTEVSAGEVARISLRMQPKDKGPKPSTTVTLLVEPTAQQIPIKVTFAIPPEVQRQIPK